MNSVRKWGRTKDLIVISDPSTKTSLWGTDGVHPGDAIQVNLNDCWL